MYTLHHYANTTTNHHEGKNILLEINTVGSQQKRILSLSNLKQDLMNDPDLCSLPGELLPQIFQTLYIVTGCDYTSFFSGIGKSTFMKYFFQFAEFITSGTAVPGTLADCSLQSDAFKTGFLAFLRLIGTVYYKKYSSAFTAPTPHSHFTSFAKTGISMKAQHVNWLEDIRNSIWDRTEFENYMVPSTEALYRHWIRSCWVVDMWSQAATNHMVLRPLTSHGWKISEDKLVFDWDSGENMDRVHQRVRGLLLGCKCKGGCNTNHCGCKRRGVLCSEGCQCRHCNNLGTSTLSTTLDIEKEKSRERSEDKFSSENEDDSDMVENERENSPLDDEVDQIMQSVFGPDTSDSDQ